MPTRSLAQLLILILRHRGREQQRRDERHERQEDSRARHSAWRERTQSEEERETLDQGRHDGAC